MRQSAALLGRLSRLAVTPAQATQPFQALARRSAGDDAFDVKNALHRFMSSAALDPAQQTVPPSAGGELQESSFAGADSGPPESAAELAGAASAENAASRGAASSSSGSEGPQPAPGPSQAGDQGGRAPRQKPRGGAPRKIDVQALQLEMDHHLKQNRPGALGPGRTGHPAQGSAAAC